MKLSLALMVFTLAADPDGAALVTVRGSLVAAGKPVADARFSLTPSQRQAAVNVDRAGRFEVKAVAAREYAIDIWAEGYAPYRKVVELDAKGIAELGQVTLEPLKTATASVILGPRTSLESAEPQKLELQHGSCANVRAQDDSGCRLQFCVDQEGPVLRADRYGGNTLRSLGRIRLSEALSKLPKGGTYVTGQTRVTPLLEGETLLAETTDPYCVALLHVDEVK